MLQMMSSGQSHQTLHGLEGAILTLSFPFIENSYIQKEEGGWGRDLKKQKREGSGER